jgi:large subunit ribosomal protein L29
MLKPQKLREKSGEELLQLENDLSEDYFKLRFQHATGQMENPTKLRMIRKDIARVKTIIRERQLDKERREADSVEEGDK